MNTSLTCSWIDLFIGYILDSITQQSNDSEIRIFSAISFKRKIERYIPKTYLDDMNWRYYVILLCDIFYKWIRRTIVDLLDLYHRHFENVFIGPESDHSFPLSLTDWLTDSLLFSKLYWCDPGVWRCQLKTCWCCNCCWWWSCW